MHPEERRVQEQVIEGDIIEAAMRPCLVLIHDGAPAVTGREKVADQLPELYVDMLAVYGRMARRAVHDEEQYTPPSAEEWRLLQARIEAFTSDRVFAFRDPYLDAWNRFLDEKNALNAADEITHPSAREMLAQHKHLVHEHALALGKLYDGLRGAIRQELRISRTSRRP